MFIEILEKIKEYNRIIIHRHIRPDGDCIGSQMGLKYYLQANFKDKEIYSVGDTIPEYLQKLGQIDVIPDEYYDDALVIVVDTSTESRICDDRWKKGNFIIKIDHHDDSPKFGNIEYVDPLSPSCSSVLCSMFKTWNLSVFPKSSAYALYFGIITDTGRFRYRGVNAEVLSNASYLVAQNIDIQEMYDNLYVDTLETISLQGYVLTHFKTTPNGVVYIHFTKKMMEKFKVAKDDAANLVNSLSTIKGSLIWVAFIDQMFEKDPTSVLPKEKEIRVRIRSRNVAVNDVASHYRGGGHLQACGATIYSLKEKKGLLEELDNALRLYKEEHPNAI